MVDVIAAESAVALVGFLCFLPFVAIDIGVASPKTEPAKGRIFSPYREVATRGLTETVLRTESKRCIDREFLGEVFLYGHVGPQSEIIGCCGQGRQEGE